MTRLKHMFGVAKGEVRNRMCMHMLRWSVACPNDLRSGSLDRFSSRWSPPTLDLVRCPPHSEDLFAPSVTPINATPSKLLWFLFRRHHLLKVASGYFGAHSSCVCVTRLKIPSKAEV